MSIASDSRHPGGRCGARRLHPALALLVALLIFPPLSPAQPETDWRISLVTIGPGEVYWSRFGHNAIMVEDQRSGRALLYNFGMFDFQQENFLLNFVRGRMIYRLAAFLAESEFDYYREIGRWVRIQRLNLSPSQSRRLVEYLEWHRQPANAEYLYDYYTNNCSTKVRDAVDLALDGQLEKHFDALPAVMGNYRDHTNRLTAPDPWMYAGTQLGLGRPVDRPISRWEEFFIPMTMMRALAEVEIRWEDGSRHPLVAESFSLDVPDPTLAPRSQPRWWPWFLAGGLALAMVILLVDRNRRRPPLSIAWWALSGMVGLVLLGLWLLTDHQAAYRNENLLLFSPVGLLLAGAAMGRWPRGVRLLAIVVLAGVALALAFKLLPGTVQDNREWLALCVPAQLAAAWLAISPSGPGPDRNANSSP